MDPITFSPFLGVLLLLFLGGGIWVAVSLLLISIIGMWSVTSAPVTLVMPQTYWSALSGWTLTALPLFVWMGEILFRSRLSDDLFQGLAPWVTRLPGRLLHVNVLGCGVFAAVSGSSAATAATVGRMSLPELKARGYDERISVGSLAASGTLGLLIPPSIMMIVYGVSANVSIGRLFIAGVFPGLMLMALLMGYIAIWALLHPGKMPALVERMTWRERLYRLRLLLPVVFLIVAVIGSIYGGYATPTEAASLGVAGSLIIAFVSGGMDRVAFRESLYGATRTSCMIGFIIGSAAFLTSVMGYSGIPRALANLINSYGLTAYPLLAALTLLFLILGCFLDGISIIVLTISIVLPMAQAAGIDPLWFGVYMVLVVEIAQITPPVGFNLFVVQLLTGRNIFYVAKATAPFFVMMLIGVAILITFPAIATWLPAQMM
ncbi:TRAP transporter large permease subunit [Pikeienuella piscinae]|uniref:TRAP transporter large permease protein n=1 Tax=Pikeienuella piscinae TaxID=2748098 RepID=A0A7L5C1S2_9RHOB|nr:TRAP transporter large permease subunit [Pikeienuella piscinae]QIE56767.1 TRAP transporter large permease subunit [Pikeienuella piscinae]